MWRDLDYYKDKRKVSNEALADKVPVIIENYKSFSKGPFFCFVLDTKQDGWKRKPSYISVSAVKDKDNLVWITRAADKYYDRHMMLDGIQYYFWFPRKLDSLNGLSALYFSENFYRHPEEFFYPSLVSIVERLINRGLVGLSEDDKRIMRTLAMKKKMGNLYESAVSVSFQPSAVKQTLQNPDEVYEIPSINYAVFVTKDSAEVWVDMDNLMVTKFIGKFKTGPRLSLYKAFQGNALFDTARKTLRMEENIDGLR